MADGQLGMGVLSRAPAGARDAVSSGLRGVEEAVAAAGHDSMRRTCIRYTASVWVIGPVTVTG
jgi:hypothetical protein